MPELKSLLGGFDNPATSRSGVIKDQTKVEDSRWRLNEHPEEQVGKARPPQPQLQQSRPLQPQHSVHQGKLWCTGTLSLKSVHTGFPTQITFNYELDMMSLTHPEVIWDNFPA